MNLVFMTVLSLLVLLLVPVVTAVDLDTEITPEEQEQFDQILEPLFQHADSGLHLVNSFGVELETGIAGRRDGFDGGRRESGIHPGGRFVRDPKNIVFALQQEKQADDVFAGRGRPAGAVEAGFSGQYGNPVNTVIAAFVLSPNQFLIPFLRHPSLAGKGDPPATAEYGGIGRKGRYLFIRPYGHEPPAIRRTAGNSPCRR